MDEAQFNKIWEDVQKETADRSGGAFKRALWYGNAGVTIRGQEIIGQNKGLRKALRNAPRKVAGMGLGAVEVPPGLSVVIEFAADRILDKGKEVYSDRVRPLIKGNPPPSAHEALRRKVKEDVKKLKGNAFEVIDRNLVKLNDAKNKVTPSIHELMKAHSAMSYTQVSSTLATPTSEDQVKKAHDALRAIAEAEYYVDKIMRLVLANETALTEIRGKLDTLKKGLVQTQSEVADYIKETC